MRDENSPSPSLEILQRAYPGAVLLTLDQAAKALCTSTKTIRNNLTRGRWPVPTVKVGAQRLVPIQGLAGYLDQLTAKAAPHKPRRGRPRKNTASRRTGGAA